MPRSRTAGRIALVSALTLVVLLLGGPRFAGRSPAFADASFNAIAGANAMDGSASDSQDFPLVGSVEGGGTYGQAQVDSNGHSQGFAAFPNPGGGAAGAPTLAGAPPYPMYINAENGQPAQEVSQPGLHLHAEAGDTSAKGFAVAGTEGAASSRSEGDVRVATDGSVTATASAAADGLVVAGTVTIGGIDATATAARDASGKLKTSAHMSIARIDAAGQSFGLRDGAFTVAGTSVPVPAATVLGVLSVAGVHAHYQEPVKTATGIIGGNFTVIFDVPATPQTARVHVVYVLGETDASISYSRFGDGSGGAASPGTGVVEPSGSLDAGAQAPAATPALSPGPAPVRVAPLSSAPVPAVAAASPQTTRAAAALVPRADGLWLYLAVLVGALGLIGTSQAVRLFGVRLLWTP
jgi:hypothetical protein